MLTTVGFVTSLVKDGAKINVKGLKGCDLHHCHRNHRWCNLQHHNLRRRHCGLWHHHCDLRQHLTLMSKWGSPLLVKKWSFSATKLDRPSSQSLGEGQGGRTHQRSSEGQAGQGEEFIWPPKISCHSRPRGKVVYTSKKSNSAFMGVYIRPLVQAQIPCIYVLRLRFIWSKSLLEKQFCIPHNFSCSIYHFQEHFWASTWSLIS